jgi:hypothetical protein
MSAWARGRPLHPLISLRFGRILGTASRIPYNCALSPTAHPFPCTFWLAATSCSG